MRSTQPPHSPRGYVQLKPFTFQPIQFVLKEKYKQWGDADGLNEAQNPITRELKNVIFGQNRDELKSSRVLGRDEFFHHVFKP